MGNGALGIEELAPVRERVGSHVDDPHDLRRAHRHTASVSEARGRASLVPGPEGPEADRPAITQGPEMTDVQIGAELLHWECGTSAFSRDMDTNQDPIADLDDLLWLPREVTEGL